MIESPLVSILCITYNHEKYIRQCLDGMLLQKTSFPFEILVHDDASFDSTAEIISEYAAKYSNIRPIYQKENQYSRNIDVNLTFNLPRVLGKYIAFCEGDDYWIDPCKLQTQVDFLESHPEYSITFHNVYKLQGNTVTPFLINEKMEYSLKDMIDNWIMPTCSVVFVYKAMDDYDHEKMIGPCGDFPLFIHLSLRGKIHYFNDIMGVYRIHENGSTNTSLASDESRKSFLSLIDTMSREYLSIRPLLHKQYAKAGLVFSIQSFKIKHFKNSFYFFWKAIKKKPFTVLFCLCRYLVKLVSRK